MISLLDSNPKGLPIGCLRSISSLHVSPRPLLTVDTYKQYLIYIHTYTAHCICCLKGVVMEDPYWQSFMEQAVRLIYFLAESPDQLCSRLLQRSARLLLNQIAEGGEMNKNAVQTEDASQESNAQDERGES